MRAGWTSLIYGLMTAAWMVAAPAQAEDPSKDPFCARSRLERVASRLRQQASTTELPHAVLDNALEAFRRAACRHQARKPVLAVIDYTRASDQKRLWVLDLADPKVLFHEWVAHGRNSGERVARKFSNVASSLRSSLGVFATGATYQGKHGLSLYLDGLEPGVNERARERSVVIHGADYVSPDFVEKHGRLGRSWGCPAVSREQAPALIETLRDGAIVFAWYPDPAWLSRSAYLPASVTGSAASSR